MGNYFEWINFNRCQFHQHFMYKFFKQTLFWHFFYIHVTREKLPKRHSYEKFVRKMLMKLTARWTNLGNNNYRWGTKSVSRIKQNVLVLKLVHRERVGPIANPDSQGGMGAGPINTTIPRPSRSKSKYFCWSYSSRSYCTVRLEDLIQGLVLYDYFEEYLFQDITHFLHNFIHDSREWTISTTF